MTTLNAENKELISKNNEWIINSFHEGNLENLKIIKNLFVNWSSIISCSEAVFDLTYNAH